MNLLLPSLSPHQTKLSHHLNIFSAAHTFLSISPILHTTSRPVSLRLYPPLLRLSAGRCSSCSWPARCELQAAAICHRDRKGKTAYFEVGQEGTFWIKNWFFRWLGWGFQGWGERRGCVNWPNSHRSELDGCICGRQEV